jgi:hypothetical protein
MRHYPKGSFLVLLLLVLVPQTSSAQPAEASPDFLFGRPGGMVGFRTGWLFASADSALFDHVRQQFTLERKDFNAPSIGADVDVALTDRTSIVAGFEFTQASKTSEYRDFVDNQRLPINQTTSVRELNLSGSFKFALTPRGREISSRAWIPAAATPYIGAGGGLLRYEFKQVGDFIDINTANLEIFSDTLRSTGWTPSAHAFGGVDVRVYKRMYVSAEGRYVWANTTPNCEETRGNGGPVCSFAGLGLDLAGFKATAGIHYLF